MLCERCGGLASLTRAPYLCSRCAETLPELAASIKAQVPLRGPSRREPDAAIDLPRPGLVAGILGCVVSGLYLLGALMRLATIRPAEPRMATIVALVGLGLGVAGAGFAIGAITRHRIGVIGTGVLQSLNALLIALVVVTALRRGQPIELGTLIAIVVLLLAAALAAIFAVVEVAGGRRGQ